MMLSYNFSRFISESFFESFKPSIFISFKITAAAYTLPANGPLPASSIPTIILFIFFLIIYLTEYQYKTYIVKCKYQIIN